MYWCQEEGIWRIYWAIHRNLLVKFLSLDIMFECHQKRADMCLNVPFRWLKGPTFKLLGKKNKRRGHTFPINSIIFFSVYSINCKHLGAQKKGEERPLIHPELKTLLIFLCSKPWRFTFLIQIYNFSHLIFNCYWN